MSVYVKENGSWTESNELWFKQNGDWKDICEVYNKVNGAWVQTFACVQEFILNSAEDVNLGAWLLTQNASAGVDVSVTIPAGETIGSTVNGSAAIQGGDLSPYPLVTLNILGNVYGKGGVSAYKNGSPAMSFDTSVVIVDSGGEVRAGGAAGGAGGIGATGDYTVQTNSYPPTHNDSRGAWDAEQWTASDTTNVCKWYDSTSTYSRWFNHAIGYLAGYLYMEDTDRPGYVYKRGTYMSAGKYKLHRAWFYSSSGGAGGAGGDGQGYNLQIAPDSGVGGTSGTGGAGQGGNGGAGGAWAVDGTDGGSGGQGYEFKRATAVANGYACTWSSTSVGLGAGVSAGAGGNAVETPDIGSVAGTFGSRISGTIFDNS